MRSLAIALRDYAEPLKSHLHPDGLDELATQLHAVRRRADLSRRLRAPGGDDRRSRSR